MRLVPFLLHKTVRVFRTRPHIHNSSDTVTSPTSSVAVVALVLVCSLCLPGVSGFGTCRSSFRCLNGGVERYGSSIFGTCRCFCPAGYTGPRCQYREVGKKRSNSLNVLHHFLQARLRQERLLQRARQEEEERENEQERQVLEERENEQERQILEERGNAQERQILDKRGSEEQETEILQERASKQLRRIQEEMAIEKERRIRNEIESEEERQIQENEDGVFRAYDSYDDGFDDDYELSWWSRRESQRRRHPRFFRR